MDIERLDLSHQFLLKARFEKLNLFLSEYSFANLYLFRSLHQYELLKCEHAFFIRGKTRDGQTFIMLTTPPDQVAEDTLHSVLPYADILFPFPAQWIPLLEGKIREASFKEEDSDYLFHTSKFLTYSGNELGAKRNLVNQLLKSHEIRAENLTPLVINEAQQVLDDWQAEQQTSIEYTDYEACLEAIHYLEKLSLTGRLLYVDNHPIGLIIGEQMTSTCYAVHFCKGKKGMIGLYQYLYQDLAHSLEEKEGWLNLEQDLGILNLRKAKHSYHPDQILPKWRLKLQV